MLWHAIIVSISLTLMWANVTYIIEMVYVYRLLAASNSSTISSGPNETPCLENHGQPSMLKRAAAS